MSDRQVQAALTSPRVATRGPGSLLVIFSLLLLILFPGCRTARQNRDVVERELRQRENEVGELKDELHKQQWLNHAMERQIVEQQHQLSSNHLMPTDPGTAGNRVQEIALGRSTGGADNDKYPGDEALVVSLEPKDSDGHVIKASGTLQVTALEILPGGVKKVLSCWQVMPDELRRLWKAGLLSTGYQVTLPWKAPPSTEKVRVVAQFITSDGRVFEADKDVKIRLPNDVKPLQHAPPLPAPEPLGAPVPLGPPPEPVEPASWRSALRVELGAPMIVD